MPDSLPFNRSVRRLFASSSRAIADPPRFRATFVTFATLGTRMACVRFVNFTLPSAGADPVNFMNHLPVSTAMAIANIGTIRRSET